MERPRKILLLLTLAIVAGLAVFAPAPEAPVVPSSRAPQARAPKSADSPLSAAHATALSKNSTRPGIPGELPGRGALGDAKADLFGPQSWQPPPPKMAAPPPPPPPQPPPMLYRFAGRLLQDGQTRIFVSKGDTPIAIKPGDNLEGYVIESITSTAISLVYPPLGSKASIAITPIPADAASPATSATPAALGTLPARAVVNPPARTN